MVAGSLHCAARGGHIEIVHLLLTSGDADVSAGIVQDNNYSDQSGKTPLHSAAQGGHIEVINILLARHATVSPRDEDGMTPLHWAAVEGYGDVVELLLSRGAEVDVVDSEGLIPLHYAVRAGHIGIIECLSAGYELTLMSIRVNEKLDTASLGNEPHLIVIIHEDGHCTYRLWGCRINVKNEYEMQLTELQNFIFPEAWQGKQKVAIF